MKKLDLDKMDDDEDDHRHRNSYDEDALSDRSLNSDDEDDDLMVPGSSVRGQRMSGVEEPMFEMR